MRTYRSPDESPTIMEPDTSEASSDISKILICDDDPRYGCSPVSVLKPPDLKWLKPRMAKPH